MLHPLQQLWLATCLSMPSYTRVADVTGTLLAGMG